MIYLIALITLGLSSCEKSDTITSAEQPNETFTWQGETFDVSETRTKLALISGTDEEQFIFVQDSLAFQWNRPTSQNVILFYIKDYIDAIKLIEL